MESIAVFVQNNPSLAVFAVFAGGIVSSASPCVLALIPLVIGYVGGYAGGDKKKAFLYAITFAFGLSITFTLMGAAAGFIGSLLLEIGSLFYWIIAIIAVAMGLSLMGLYEINIPFRSKLQVKTGGLLGAVLMGLLFGLASTPCATPVLVVILAFVAGKGQVLYGIFLLFVYAIGHCALIVVAGVATGFVSAYVGSKKTANISLWLKRISGALIVAAGIYLAFTNI